MGNIIVGAILFVIVALAVISIYKKHRNAKKNGSCCCGCSGCSGGKCCE
ncbi:MAG: FeoB-associated Cys-rich membrane protein [Treponema sp.]|nr:FeoB-associated Cys-rich membrane protein [Candidatus Treponema equifaecale]